VPDPNTSIGIVEVFSRVARDFNAIKVGNPQTSMSAQGQYFTLEFSENGAPPKVYLFDVGQTAESDRPKLESALIEALQREKPEAAQIRTRTVTRDDVLNNLSYDFAGALTYR